MNAVLMSHAWLLVGPTRPERGSVAPWVTTADPGVRRKDAPEDRARAAQGHRQIGAAIRSPSARLVGLGSAEMHRLCQPEISGRPANPQGVRAGLPDPGMRIRVEARKGASRNHHPRFCLLAGAGFHGSEPRKTPEWPAGIVVRSLEVRLHDLAAGSVACVADRHHQREVLVLVQVLGFQRQRVIAPVRVAETVAETEERLAFAAVVTAIADQETLGVRSSASPWTALLPSSGCSRLQFQERPARRLGGDDSPPHPAPQGGAQHRASTWRTSP